MTVSVRRDDDLNEPKVKSAMSAIVRGADACRCAVDASLFHISQSCQTQRFTANLTKIRTYSTYTEGTFALGADGSREAYRYLHVGTGTVHCSAGEGREG